MRGLPLQYDRTLGMQVVFAHVLPLAFGGVCGVALEVSRPAFVALGLLAVVGGFLAGLEHESARDGLVRGVTSGALFGAGLLTAHELAGKAATVELPDPPLLLVAVTAAVGAVLGAAGGALRRLTRNATARPGPDTGEAQSHSRNVASVARDWEERATSAEHHISHYEEQLARLRSELKDATSAAERQQTRAERPERRSGELAEQLAGVHDELEHARAEADQQIAQRERQVAAAQAAEAKRAERIAALQARSEHIEQTADQLLARSRELAEGLTALDARAARTEQPPARSRSNWRPYTRSFSGHTPRPASTGRFTAPCDRSCSPGPRSLVSGSRRCRPFLRGSSPALRRSRSGLRSWSLRRRWPPRANLSWRGSRPAPRSWFGGSKPPSRSWRAGCTTPRQAQPNPS